MIILLYILAFLAVYAFIGRRLMPYFTKYAYDWKKTWSAKHPMRAMTEESMRTAAVSDGTIYGFIWPMVWIWSKYSIRTGATGQSNDLFEKRMMKLSDKRHIITAQNRKLAEELGFESDEYNS